MLVKHSRAIVVRPALRRAPVRPKDRVRSGCVRANRLPTAVPPRGACLTVRPGRVLCTARLARAWARLRQEAGWKYAGVFVAGQGENPPRRSKSCQRGTTETRRAYLRQQALPGHHSPPAGYRIVSLPPIYMRSGSGTRTDPSAQRLFSKKAISIRGGATTVLFSVWGK